MEKGKEAMLESEQVIATVHLFGGAEVLVKRSLGNNDGKTQQGEEIAVANAPPTVPLFTPHTLPISLEYLPPQRGSSKPVAPDEAIRPVEEVRVDIRA